MKNFLLGVNLKSFHKSLVFLFFLIIFSKNINAQVNQKVENFTLLNVQDDKNVSLNDFLPQSLVVIIVTSASCPYSNSYKDRLINLVKKYEKNAKFLFLNPENTQDATKLQETAKTYQSTYLLDKDQKITTLLQATKTPEVFVLQANVGSFFLKYHGAIDDNPQVAEDVTKKYLEDALQNLINKKNIEVNYYKPTGCMIKK